MSLLDQSNEQEEQIDPAKNYLEELVGTDKKFKSAEELARGKYQSDSYIKILEKRLDIARDEYTRVREENMAKAKLEELIDQIKPSQQSSNNTQNVNDTVRDKPPFDPKEIDGLVEAKLKALKTFEKAEQNNNLVKNKLKEQFGENYQTAVKKHIESLDMSEDLFNHLAGTNPTVLFRTLGIDQTNARDNYQAPPRSNMRSDSFAPKTQKRTWSYYQDLRKKDPKAFLDRKTAIQMDKDYQELGKEFEDGDFNS
jgi:hypothetical protein